MKGLIKIKDEKNLATREENLKKINDNLEKLSVEELDKVAGGSLYLNEEEAKKAGITLKKKDGSPGSFGYMWNTGDYYWNDKKISDKAAYSISYFVEAKGRQPSSVKEAIDCYEREAVVQILR